MRRYSIQNKIVVPFTLLFIVVIIISTVITLTLFNRKYDEKISQETAQWVKVIFQTNYYEEIEKVKDAFGVEIVIFSVDNGVMSTTLNEGLSKEIARAVKLKKARAFMAESRQNSFSLDINYRGEPYKVIHYDLEQYGRIYTLMRGMSEISAAKRQVMWTMIGVAASGILLVVFVGHRIAKNITAPVKRLVTVTQQVASGDLTREGQVTTRDEIGELTLAFNQMTRQLRQSQQELVETERLAMAGKMAAAFAHDIRNPLSSIKMMIQLLRKRVQPGEENQQYIRSIIEEIDRLDIIIKSMMDFARPVELNLQVSDVNAVLCEVFSFMEAKLNHHNITLVKQLSDEVPPIPLDVDKLKHAIMNIVLNAIQAMPNGGRLEVVTQLCDAEIKVKMSDTGVGIPIEALSRLFEPFFTTKTEGTGLGLTNAQRILRQHSGDIAIESIVDTGTTVMMSLPISKS